MNIDSIKNGYVIDHIKAGNGMKIYNYLKLNELECPVAIIKNVNRLFKCLSDIIKNGKLAFIRMWSNMTNKDIERSIIKKYRKDIWTPFVKGINDYQKWNNIINMV